MKKLALLLILVACSPSSPSFNIVPRAAALDPGKTLLFAATGALPPPVWTATAGTISTTGLFTAPGCSALLPQTITVTAATGGFTATATVTVDDRVTGLTVSPTPAAVPANGTQQFTALVKTICIPAGVPASMPVAPAALKATPKAVK